MNYWTCYIFTLWKKSFSWCDYFIMSGKVARIRQLWSRHQDSTCYDFTFGAALRLRAWMQITFMVYDRKTRLKTHTLWNIPCRIFLSCFPGSYISTSLRARRRQLLTWWPWPLTYELDLDIFPLDLHGKIQVCLYLFSRQRSNTHSEKQCQNYYTHHFRYFSIKMTNTPDRTRAFKLVKAVHHTWQPDLTNIFVAGGGYWISSFPVRPSIHPHFLPVPHPPYIDARSLPSSRRGTRELSVHLYTLALTF